MNRNILFRILPLFLTMGCAVAIFMFSKQNGVDSSTVSNHFLQYVLAFCRQVPVSEITASDLTKYSFLVRKLAHFSIYFVLGVFTYWSTYALFQKYRVLTAASFCVLYAVSDEIHQLFSKGRSCSLRDVGIDSAGALLGIGFMYLFIRCFCRHRRTVSKES